MPQETLTGCINRNILIPALRRAIVQFEADVAETWEVVIKDIMEIEVPTGFFGLGPKRHYSREEAVAKYNGDWHFRYSDAGYAYLEDVRLLAHTKEMLRAVEHSAVTDVRLTKADLLHVRDFLPSEE